MKISCPSYIIPGTYAENADFLDGVPQIENIELLLFLYDQEVRNLFLTEKNHLEASRFTFSLHLPDLIEDKHREILDHSHNFVGNYIIHPPKLGEEKAFALLLNQWRYYYGDRFYLENTIERDWKPAAELLQDIPLCMDTGHLLVRGESPAEHLKNLGHRIKEIHLHGVRNGKNHQDFDSDESWFQELLPHLENWDGILNIEVFDETSLKKVLTVLEKEELLPLLTPDCN